MSVSHADLTARLLGVLNAGKYVGQIPLAVRELIAETAAAVAVWEEETSRLREQLEALEAGSDRLSAVAVAEVEQTPESVIERAVVERASMLRKTFPNPKNRMTNQEYARPGTAEWVREARRLLDDLVESSVPMEHYAATSDGPQAVATEIDRLRAERDEAQKLARGWLPVDHAFERAERAEHARDMAEAALAEARAETARLAARLAELEAETDA